MKVLTAMKMSLAVVVFALAGAAAADTEKVNGYTWTYQIVDGQYAMIYKGTGEAAISPAARHETLVIPAKLGGKPVGCIGYSAFKDCTEMTGVVIPSTVTEIERLAFSGCSMLRSVKLPDKVTKIQAFAFEQCAALQCVEFGKSLAYIGANAFNSCNSLRSLVFRGKNSFVEDYNVYNNSFPDGLEDCTAYVPKAAKGWPESEQGMPPSKWLGKIGVSREECTALVKVEVSGSAIGRGTVSGGGSVVVGKKTTIKAKANSGYVFAGWADGNTGNLLSYSTSYSYTATGAAESFYALFVDTATDSSIHIFMVDVETDADGSAYLDVKVSSWSEPKIKFKGLPSGIKYDSAKKVLTGKAKKPGVYKVTISATNKSVKKAVTGEFCVTVPNFVDPAIPVEDSYGVFIPGNFAIWTIDAAAGCKVTGLPSGLKWTAKATVDSATKISIPANSVYGSAKKVGDYTVYFTKTVGKVKHTATSTFKVESAYGWAVGTYSGGNNNGIGWLEIAEDGSISGKWFDNGGTWKLSSDGFSGYDEGMQAYLFSLSVGGSSTPIPAALYEFGVIEFTNGTGIDLYKQPDWSKGRWRTAAAKFGAADELERSYADEDSEWTFTLKFASDGSAAVKCRYKDVAAGSTYQVSGTFAIIPTNDVDPDSDAFEGFVHVFLPANEKFPGYCKRVGICWTGSEFLFTSP